MAVVIPMVWRKVTLHDVCEEKTGIRDPRSTPHEDFLYVDISAVDNKTKRIIQAKRVQGNDAPSRARQVIRSGDILVSTTRPNLNAVALVPPELDNQICSTGFCVLRPKDNLDSEFLFAYARSPKFVESLSRLVKGALYPAITDRQVRVQEISLPPLVEQRRVAEILTEQMVAIEKAREATITQLEAARSLAKCILRAAFSSGDADKWPKKRLGDLATSDDAFCDGPFGSNLKSEHYASSGARVIRLQNIGAGIFLDGDKARISLDHFASLRRHSVKQGDVVVAALGDGARPAGRACLVPDDLGPAIVKADCFRVRLPKESILSTFLVTFLNSPQSLSQFSEAIRGATRPRINLKLLRRIAVPVPSLQVQQRLVAKVVSVMQISRDLTQSILAQAAALDSLPGRILDQAMNGEVQ